MSVTDGDRERAAALVLALRIAGETDRVAAIAQALADERERAIEPFTALADEMEHQVEFRRAGDQVMAPVADVRETDLRWLRLAISNAKDPR